MSAQTAAKPVAPQAQTYHDHQSAASLGGFVAASDMAACLLPLLRALRWRGNPRQISEALPHFAETLDLTGLRNVMAHLNYSSRPENLRLSAIDPRLMPCLYLPDDGPAMVVLAKQGREITVFDGSTASTVALTRPRMRGIAYFFAPIPPDDGVVQARVGWFRSILDRFRTLFWQAFAITFLINVLSLATPLFVMSVYDKVVATGSMDMLAWFTVGVTIALATDWILRQTRAKILAFVGARLDNIVGSTIFERILALPPAFTERATIGAQVARIKDFESVREFFTGPLAMVFLELPFAFFYFGVIFVLGGAVAIVPVLGFVAFFVLGMAVLPTVRRNVNRASRAGSRRQEFLVETMGKMRQLKLAGAEKTWQKRYRDMSARGAYAGFKNAQFTNLIGTLSHALIIIAGLGTIVMGVVRVLDGTMTMGGLIASMMLVWRVLSPLQTGFMMITRVEQVRASIRQIDNLMNMKPERDPRAMAAPIKNIKGKVVFSRVSLRYSNDADPALVGVSFDVEPGEVVAVTGRNGSGKSTILKLIAGLYQPQAGNVRIDNMDIRQLDPVELRHALAYVPQTCNLFHGTVAQNLRLAMSTASDADLRWAAEQADVYDEIAAMPRGFNTRIGDAAQDHLPTSFVQKLSLARAFLKRSSIMLFDEPVNGLDFEGDRAFMRAVENVRGHTTVFIVTHRPSHLRIADKVLVFDSGYLRLAGRADEVIARMPKDLI